MKKSILSLITMLLAVMLLFSSCAGLSVVENTTVPPLATTDEPHDVTAPSADAPTLPNAHFYIMGTVSPEEIATLFGEGYSPKLSRWFPVKQIDSKAALQAFCVEARNIMSLDYNAPASFADAVTRYDDAYFAENVLAIGSFWSSDQRYQYSLMMYSRVGKDITFGVDDYVGAAEMAVCGNLMVVELPRTEVEGMETFNAYLNEPQSSISAADRQSVAEINFRGTHVFSGSYARKLTEDLAALAYTKPLKGIAEYYSTATVKTAYGSYEFVINTGEVYQGEQSAKYAMGSILQRIVDHYPKTIVEDYTGEVGYISEETHELIADLAEPTVEGMLPIVRLDSWEELIAFVAATDEEFRIAVDTAELDAFIASQKEEFGEDFFEGYSLLVTCFYSSSGSFSYYLTDLKITPEGTLTMRLLQKTHLAGAVTDDVVDWVSAVRVPTELLTEVTHYGAIGK